MICGEITSTGKSPAGTFGNLINILARNPSCAQGTVSHAPISPAVPEVSDFSFTICLAYVTTGASILAAKHTTTTSKPTKRTVLQELKVRLRSRKRTEEQLHTQISKIENFLTRYSIQLTVFYFSRTIWLLFCSFSLVTVAYGFSVGLNSGFQFSSFVQRKCVLWILPCPTLLK